LGAVPSAKRRAATRVARQIESRGPVLAVGIAQSVAEAHQVKSLDCHAAVSSIRAE